MRTISSMGWMLLLLLLAMSLVLSQDVKQAGPKETDFPEFYAKKYPEKPAPGREVYTLSGGEAPSTPILADDDLTVRLNGEMIFADNDGWCTTDDRGGKWKGTPIKFHAKADDKFTLVLYDLVPNEWKLGPVYLHRADGKRALVVALIAGTSEPVLNNGLFTSGPPRPNAQRDKRYERTFMIKDLIK